MLNDINVIKISFPYCITHKNNISNIIFKTESAMPSLLDKDDELVLGSLLVPTNDSAAGLKPFLIDEFS